jgi:hypothetical protein
MLIVTILGHLEPMTGQVVGVSAREKFVGKGV